MSAKEIRKKALSTAAKRLKRAFDVLVALCGLLVFSPAFVVLYFVIRHEDGGPAIFRQERIGRGGRPFMLYKFRSMVVSSEADGQPALCQKNDARTVILRSTIFAPVLSYNQIWVVEMVAAFVVKPDNVIIDATMANTNFFISCNFLGYYLFVFANLPE